MKTKELLSMWTRQVNRADTRLLVENVSLARLAQAWGNIPIQWNVPEEIPPEVEPNQVWDWMWSFCEYDWEELSLVSAISEAETIVGINRLIQCGLILPDGSYPEEVGHILEFPVEEAEANIMALRFMGKVKTPEKDELEPF